MASLVEQIQREAIDHAIPVSQLLRRVKLAAFKLKLDQGVAWADHELEGYYGKAATLPAYRIITGAPVAQNPMRGWIPIQAPAPIVERISRWPIVQSVSSLEELARGSESLFFRYDAELTARLNANMMVALPVMGIQVHPSVILGLIDQVRGSVLDWAMALEAQGILGDEISFSSDELKRAASMTINIGAMHGGNLNTGDLSGQGARLNQGSSDHSVNTVVGESQLFAEIEDALAGVKDQAARETLVALTREMKAAQGKPGFVATYQKFVTAAADHMTVLTPFLPALTALLGS